MIRRNFFKSLFGGAAALELPEVKHAEILRLEPDDTIVITVQGHPSQETIERIHVLIQSKFPGHKVLVKDGCVDISVIKGSRHE